MSELSLKLGGVLEKKGKLSHFFSSFNCFDSCGDCSEFVWRRNKDLCCICDAKQLFNLLVWTLSHTSELPFILCLPLKIRLMLDRALWKNRFHTQLQSFTINKVNQQLTWINISYDKLKTCFSGIHTLCNCRCCYCS